MHSSGFTTLRKFFALSALTLAITGCTSDNNDDTSNVVQPPSNATAIHTIQEQSKTYYDEQGTFVESPIEGKIYTVAGVVTSIAPGLKLKDFTKKDVCNGVYFIQTADQLTQNANISDGLMICNNELSSNGLAQEFNIGDSVAVTGTAHEVYNETQLRITSSHNTEKLENTGWSANPTLITDDLPLNEIHEKYEGMLVQLEDGRWFVTDHYNLGRYGEIELAKDNPLWKPTNLYPAESDEAIAEQAKNDSSRLVISNGISDQNQDEFTFYERFSAENPIRLGNTADGVEGVARYAYRKVQIIPTQQLAFGEGISPRNEAPVRESGQFRVASMNVLNYFNGRYDQKTGEQNHNLSDAKDANGKYHNNRGATTKELFERQRAKIINAIAEMDADIVGLMEIENDGFGEHSAIQDLVNGINEKLDGKRTYAFVEHDDNQIGTDAITTGMIYDTQLVNLSGNSKTIELPIQQFEQEKTKNGKTTTSTVIKAQRPSFVQTFSTKEGNNPLTVVVNHLKSKGSGCWEDEPDNLVEDGQQHCNAFRVAAVDELGNQLKSMDSLSDNVLLIGDFNSYAQEDPILLLTNNDEAGRTLTTASKLFLNDSPVNGGESQDLTETFGYTNLLTYIHPDDKAYSYSYSGELGNLDHAFGSQALVNKITNVQDWHINSVESTMLDYTTKYKPKDKLESLYAEDAFRSSDHDPVVIDINFNI